MKLFLCSITIVILILLYRLFKQLNKNILITLLCSFFIVYFVIYPQLCINSTINGAKMFFMSVFPSLFPFIVICNILLSYDGIVIYSTLLGNYLCLPLKLPKSCSFVLIVSAFCGYPLGAKYTCELYEKRIITKEECERLLNIASNASPLFVIGSIGTTMLHSPAIGYMLLTANYMSCTIMGIFLPSKSYSQINFRENTTYNFKKESPNLGTVLKESIDNAIKTSLSVGGYITLFSAIIDIVKNNSLFNNFISYIPPNLIAKELSSGIVLGLIEITKGSLITSNSDSNMLSIIFIIGFLIGFSGLSIISQVYSFTSKYSELSIIKYIKRKFVQGIICGLCSMLIFFFFSLSLNIQPAITQTAHTKFTISLWISLLIISPLIFKNLKKLFHVS